MQKKTLKRMLTCITLIMTVSVLTSAALPLLIRQFDDSLQDGSEVHDNLIIPDDRIYSSAGDIDIITPANSTYDSPMNDYYLGTYGFENDENGQSPDNWTNTCQTNAEAYVVDSLGDHKKVVRCYSSTDSSSYLRLRKNFNAQNNGTIEFWIYKSSSYEGGPAIISVVGETHGSLITLLVDDNWDDKIQYRTPAGSYSNLAYSYYDNLWFHIRFDFDCGSDTYNLTIDGDQYLTNEDFVNSVDESGVDQLSFGSFDSANPCLYYIDAVGFSWDPTYDVGDNFEEGLLISYDTTFTQDWAAYSLDGSKNYTILGNKTIPVQPLGAHSLVISANDTSGNNYTSETRWFSNPFSISLTNPDNITYQTSMSGYFPATWNFLNESSGGLPDGWVDTSDSYADAHLVNGLTDHNKVIMCSSETFSDSTLRLTRSLSTQTDGTLEFWFYKSSSNEGGPAIISLGGSTHSSLIRLRIDDNAAERIQYETTSGSYSNVGYDYSDDVWFHIRVDFDCATDKYNLTIDGTTCLSNVDFIDSVDETGLDDIRFTSYSLGNPCTFFLDAFGFSWDENYNVGDNRYYGLYVTYSTDFTHTWAGYSVDNGPVVTLQGPTAIPTPGFGLHKIQAFANTSLDVQNASKPVYFTIPNVTLNAPKNITYTEPDAGYYISTYGFDDDENGQSPSRWTDNSDTFASVQVIESLDGHKKVAECSSSSSSNSDVRLSQSIDSVVAGTIEFWFYKSSSQENGPATISISGETQGSVITLIVDDEQYERIDYRTPSGSYSPVGYSYSDDNWFHIQIDFDCASDTYSLIIDGASYLDDSNFAGSVDETSITALRFGSYGSVNPALYYIDAVGFSWDPNYDKKYNLYEGMLISYTKMIDHDWAGYSIDGGANSTIDGNITVPLPSNGVHKLNLYSNKTSGGGYEVDSEWFTVDYYEMPTLTEMVSDFSVKQGELAEFSWRLIADQPDEYEVYQNGTLVSTQDFANNTVCSHLFQNWTVGEIEYIVKAYDVWNNTVEDSIIVTILPDDIDPVILDLDDNFVTYQGTPAQFSWKIVETNPNYYQLFENGTLIDQQPYVNDTVIQHSFRNWTIGEIEFEIVIYDDYGHSVSDTINITILREVNDPIIAELDSNFSVYQGETAEFSWKIIEDNPNYYQLIENGTLIRQESFANDTLIDYSFINWTIGEIEFEIVAYDTTGRSCFDTINITILHEPYDPIIQDLDDDFSTYQGVEGSFTWKIDEDNPDYYQLFENGTLVKQEGFDNNTVIEYSFTNWTICNIEFEIVAYDTAGHSSSDIIMVTVQHEIIDPMIVDLTNDFSILQWEEASFSWKILDMNPDYYVLYQNSTLVKQESYENNTLIEYTFKNWTIGELDFTIIAFDTLGNYTYAFLHVEILHERDNPIITEVTEDFSVYQGQNGSFSWKILETDPLYYQIRKDGLLVKQESYVNDSLIEYEFSNWTLGPHEFNITAYDGLNNWSSQIINVEVLSRPNHYHFAEPDTILDFDLTAEQQISVQLELSEPGFLKVTSGSSDLHDYRMWKNMTTLIYYQLEVYDTALIEDGSIIESVRLRIYFDDDEVWKPSNLLLFHYDADSEAWDTLSFTLNEDGGYIECTLEHLSHFCIAEITVSPFMQFIDDNLILLIIIGVAAVVSIVGFTIYRKRGGSLRDLPMGLAGYGQNNDDYDDNEFFDDDDIFGDDGLYDDGGDNSGVKKTKDPDDNPYLTRDERIDKLISDDDDWFGDDDLYGENGSSATSSQSSSIAEYRPIRVDNTELIKKLDANSTIESTADFDPTVCIIPEELKQKILKFEWSDEEFDQFINEIRSLSLDEQNELLDEMLFNNRVLDKYKGREYGVDFDEEDFE